MQETQIQHRENLTLRLETLNRIRWLAVTGQAAAVLYVHFFLGFELPLLLCFLLIGMSAWLNVFLRLRYPGNVRWRGRSVTALLGYDILQLAVLLFLTGGIQNPFSFLIAVPVLISSASQRIKNVMPLVILALTLSLILVFFHLPLPWFEPGGLSLPLELKGGIWVAIALTTCFTAIYIFRVANESRKLADALAATELVLQREQHITNLDGLAAAAAHELGTPLATISLVAKEMILGAPTGSTLKEDAELLKSQADRCREILKKLSSLSSQEDENIAHLSLGLLLEEIAPPYHGTETVIRIDVAPSEGEGDQVEELREPVMKRNSAVLYGIGNLLENAVDFAQSHVEIHGRWNGETVSVTIADDGPGFSETILEKIGDPYISMRNRESSQSGGGLGLGLFIAKTLLERNGAKLVFSNRSFRAQSEAGSSNQTGAKVQIIWDRAKFEENVRR